MIDKTQMMAWKKIAYDAQEIICQCDNKASVEKLKELADELRLKINSLDISELRKLNTEKGIAVPEYADMLDESLSGESPEVSRTRNCANALLTIVVDMRYGSLNNNDFYKKIAREGESNGGE